MEEDGSVYSIFEFPERYKELRLEAEAIGKLLYQEAINGRRSMPPERDEPEYRYAVELLPQWILKNKDKYPAVYNFWKEKGWL